MELCEELRQTAGDAGNGLDRESREAICAAIDEIERLREALANAVCAAAHQSKQKVKVP